MKSLSDLFKEKQNRENRVYQEKVQTISVATLSSLFKWLKKTFSSQKREAFLNSLTIILKEALTGFSRTIFRVKDKDVKNELARVREAIVSVEKAMALVGDSGKTGFSGLAKKVKSLNKAISGIKNTTFSVKDKNTQKALEQIKLLASSAKRIDKHSQSLVETIEKEGVITKKQQEELKTIVGQAKDTIKLLSAVLGVLEKINKQVGGQKYPKTIRVSNLDELEKKITQLSKDIKSLSFPETDVSPIIKGLGKLETTIKNLQFPVPNFKSSFEHSLSMQLDEQDLTIHYNDNQDVDYLEAELNGKTYRKTLTYDANGNPISISKWVEQ